LTKEKREILKKIEKSTLKRLEDDWANFDTETVSLAKIWIEI
jgi:hypothetical protein